MRLRIQVGSPEPALFVKATSTKITPGPWVIKRFSYSTQLSMNFQLLIKTNMEKMKLVLAFKLSEMVCFMLINVKMSTIVDILTCMSMINFMLI